MVTSWISLPILILIAFATRSLSQGDAEDDLCTSLKGTCQSTSSTCKYNFVSGLCPSSPSTVKCCVPPDTKCFNVVGQCKDVSAGCSSGSFLNNYCPNFPASIKCCPTRVDSVIQDRACWNAGGTCMATSSNSCSSNGGTFKDNLCPSSGNTIKCCSTPTVVRTTSTRITSRTTPVVTSTRITSRTTPVVITTPDNPQPSTPTVVRITSTRITSRTTPVVITTPDDPLPPTPTVVV
ncbi:hypothetical protein BJ742DRAFT_815355 [Cladochytrium replicatum]|nr:hypothetical protein BJ742DRAFT_815355 [Cladochytrium replicatum]